MEEKAMKYLEELKEKLYEAAIDIRLGTMKRPFLWLLAIHIIVLSGLLRVNYSYDDDNARALWGYKNFSPCSRWLAQYGCQVVNDGEYLTDVSPLTQYIAIVIMAMACAVLLRVFIREDKIPLWSIIVVLPLGLSPYFLECFSFKFDSPYMALSVFGSVFPFLWWRWNTKFFIMSFIGLLVMANTYQASSGVYGLMALFLILQEYIRGEDNRYILGKIKVFVGAYLLSMGFYKIVMVTEYSGPKSTSLVAAKDIFTSIYEKSNTYLATIKGDLPQRWTMYFYGIAVMIIVMVVRTAKRNRIVAALFGVCALFLGLIGSYGAFLVVKTPLFEPRGMVGAGAYVAILGAFLVGIKCRLTFDKIFCFLLTWSCVVYSFTYANALAETRRYTDFRLMNVVQDLSIILPPQRSGMEIQVQGSFLPPIVKKMSRKYPILKRNVTRVYFGGRWTDEAELCIFGEPSKHVWIGKLNFKKLNLPKILETNYHIISSDGKHILVEVR